MPIDTEQVRQFLAALSRAPDTARIRAFFHADNPRKRLDPATGKPDKGRKGPLDLAAIAQWQAEGRGIYLVINAGGDTDKEITYCVAFFLEWDHRPVDWQVMAWKELGLPQPSLVVLTGGKSAHLYWILSEPIPVDRWRDIQTRLLDFADADRTLKNASRVMRLPGCAYMDASGNPTGEVQLVDDSGLRYLAADIEATLPTTEQQRAVTAGRGIRNRTDFPIATLDDIRDALACIPAAVPKAGQRPFWVRLTAGLIRACEEAGATAETAQALIEAHSPGFREAYQITTWKFEAINANTFWYWARHHGWSRTSQATQQPISRAGIELGATTPPDPQPRLLTRHQCRHRLHTAIDDDLSPADIEILIDELAGASELHPATLRALVLAIREESRQREAIAEAGDTLQAEAERRDATAIDLDTIFPSFIAYSLRSLTRHLPYDDRSIACAYLAGVAGLLKLGTRVNGNPATHFEVPVNLYMATVGCSGQKKSPLERLLVVDPTHSIRQDLARNHSRAMDNWREQCRGMKANERPAEPRPVRIHIQDYTGEALTAQLQTQEAANHSILIRRDEIAGLFGSLNAYRSGRGGDEQQLLELFDGHAFTSLRIAAGDRGFERCQVSIYGAIQPDVLQALVKDGDPSGKWARFCFSCLPRRTVPLPTAITDAELAEVNDGAETLQFLARTIYSTPPRVYHLDPDGIRRFSEFEHGRQILSQSTSNPSHQALWGKSAGKVLRFAGLLQVLWIAAGALPAEHLIGLPILELAIAMVESLDTYALEIHQRASGADDQITRLMRRIHTIATNAAEPMGWKAIRAAMASQERKDLGVNVTLAEQAMRTLAEKGFGEIQTGQRGAIQYKAAGELP